MMLPILISVSLAPLSYFFCASAPLQEAASTTRAAERTAGRSLGASIGGSPRWGDVSQVRSRALGGSWGGIEYLPPAASKKKPPATFVAGGCFTSPEGRGRIAKRSG